MSDEEKGLIRGALRRVLLEKGGPGSGHPGHRGRQGTRGGSLPSAAGTHPGGRGVPDFSDMEKRAFISEKTRVVDGQTIYAIVSLRRMVVYRDKPYRMETSTGRRGGKFTSPAQERAAKELATELLDEVTTRITLEGWKKNERGYWVAPWGPQTMKRIRLTTRQAPDRTLGELLTYLDDDGILFVPRDVTGFDYMERQRNKDHDAYWLKKIRRLRNDFYDRNFEAVPEDEPYPYEGPSYDEWLLEQQVDALTEPPELPPAEEPPPEEEPPEEVEAPIAEEGAPDEGGLGGEIPLPEAEPDEEEEPEEEQSLALRIIGALRRIITRGGPGSGHRGHRGRIGEVGGSESGKGAPRGKVTGTGVGVAQKPDAYVGQPKLAPGQIGPSVLRKMKRILNPITSIAIRDDVPHEDWKTVLHEVQNGEWAEGETYAGGVAKDGMNRWEQEEIYSSEEGDPEYELNESALDDHLQELNYENVQSFMVDQWHSVENEARREVDAEITTYEDMQNLLGMTEDEFVHYGEADIKNAIELEVQKRATAMLVSRGQLEVAALEQIEAINEYLPGGRRSAEISAARRGEREFTPTDIVDNFNTLINTTRYEIAEEYVGEITRDDINIDQFLTPVEREPGVIGYEAGEYIPSAIYVELLSYDGDEPVCAAQLRRTTIDLDDIPEEVIAQIEAQTGLSRHDVSKEFFALKLIQSKRAHEGYGSEMIMEVLGMAAAENRGIVGSATMSAAMFYSKLGAVGYSEVFQTEGGTAFWTAEQVSEAYEWLQSEAARIAAGGEVPETYAQEVGVPRPVSVGAGGPRVLLSPPHITETSSGHTYMEFPAGRANVEFPTDMPLMYQEPGVDQEVTIYARQDEAAGGVSYWIDGPGWEGMHFSDSTAAAQALENAGYTAFATSTPDAASDWISNYIAEQWELRGPVTLGEFAPPGGPAPPLPPEMAASVSPMTGPWYTPEIQFSEPHEGEYGRGQLVQSTPAPGDAEGGDVRIGIGDGDATMVVPDIANRWYRSMTETAAGEEVQLVPLGDGQGGVQYEVIGAAPSFYEELGEERYFGSIDQAVAALENSGYAQLNNTRPSASGFVRDLWVGAYDTIWSGPPEPTALQAGEPSLPAGYVSGREVGAPYQSEQAVSYGEYERGEVIEMFEPQRGITRVTVATGREIPLELPDDPTGWVRDDGVQIDIVPTNAQGSFALHAKLIEGERSDVAMLRGRNLFYGMTDVMRRLRDDGFEPIEGSSPSADIGVRNQWLDVYDDVMGNEVPTTVEASLYGSMRRVIIERDPGGEGSGHRGHRGRIGEVGGSEPGKGAPRAKPIKAPSKIQVGITSARPGKAPRTVFKEMNEFKKRMSEIKGVKNLSVQPGLGGWEGGSEPTWVVTYSGDGDALRLIADTARQYNQEAVLLMRECEPPRDCSPVIDFSFADPVTPDERKEVDNLLVKMGIGGWTWFRDGEGHRVLRSVAVPQWGGQRQEHLSATRRLRKMFDAIDMPHEYAENEAWVDVMEREGDYAYEAVLTP